MQRSEQRVRKGSSRLQLVLLTDVNGRFLPGALTCPMASQNWRNHPQGE